MTAANLPPSAILTQLLSLLPRQGQVLDLACGAGRNAIFLAKHGWRVTAIDSSRAALALARSAAQSIGIEVVEGGVETPSRLRPALRGRIELVEANLERVQLPRKQFHLIICFNYLQRSLFHPIEEALLPRGILLYETFTRAQLQFPAGPRNLDHLLEPGELRIAFPSLTRLYFRELSAGKGIATLLARKSE